MDASDVNWISMSVLEETYVTCERSRRETVKLAIWLEVSALS